MSCKHRLDRKGVTIIELVVVITVIGVLAMVLGMSFRGWLLRYKVEAAAKELQVDLLNARARSMQTQRPVFVAIPTDTNYRVYEDTNPSPDGDGALQTASDNLWLNKTIERAIIQNSVSVPFSIDRHGIINTTGALRFANTDGADYDCVLLNETRILEGKWSGTACVAK